MSTACPRCGEPLVAQTVGGAYRSIAKHELTCSGCHTVVVALNHAESNVGGNFSATRKTEWVKVVVAMKCPSCRRPLSQNIMTTGSGEAEIERCVPCGLLVIDPHDRARLAGA